MGNGFMAGVDYQNLTLDFRRAQSVEEIHSVCSDLCRQFGFDCFFYGYRLPVSHASPQFFIISGFPKEWQALYKQKKYHEIDPILIHCKSSLLPAPWASLKNSASANPRVRGFFRDASKYGLKNGLTCPIYCRGSEGAVFSVATADVGVCTDAHIEHVTPLVHSLSYHLQQAVSRLVDVREIGLAQKLTRRERECLAWSAEGKSSWDIATILGISERTVFFHVSNAMEKLGVTSRQHAIAKALSFGVL